MVKYIQIAGTWRANQWLKPKKISRQNADAELKKLCAKYLQDNSENPRKELRFA